MGLKGFKMIGRAANTRSDGKFDLFIRTAGKKGVTKLYIKISPEIRDSMGLKINDNISVAISDDKTILAIYQDEFGFNCKPTAKRNLEAHQSVAYVNMANEYEYIFDKDFGFSIAEVQIKDKVLYAPIQSTRPMFSYG